MGEATIGKTMSRTRSIVFCALSIAFMTVAAWVTVPFGPVPFTLQTLAVVFVLFALTPKQAMVAIAGYLVLGAIGLPVFSSFKGGLAALLGPTGGFIIGFLIAGGVALIVGALLSPLKTFSSTESRSFFGTRIKVGELARMLVMGVVFLVGLYLFGWVQLMIVGNLGPEAAFLAAVAPFIPIDILKMIAAVLLASAVAPVLASRHAH